MMPSAPQDPGMMMNDAALRLLARFTQMQQEAAEGEAPGMPPSLPEEISEGEPAPVIAGPLPKPPRDKFPPRPLTPSKKGAEPRK